MVMRASALQIIPNQLFGEVSGATICVVHHNNIGKLEECIKRKKVVYCILGMACNHSDNDCISRIEPEDLLGKDRKSTRLNSSHLVISYAVFCLKKKKSKYHITNSEH